MNESIKAQFTCLLRPPSSTWKTSSSIPLIYLRLFRRIHLPPSCLQLLKLMSYVSYDFICALVFYLGVQSSSECIRKKNCTIKIILENPSPHKVSIYDFVHKPVTIYCLSVWPQRGGRLLYVGRAPDGTAWPLLRHFV